MRPMKLLQSQKAICRFRPDVKSSRGIRSSDRSPLVSQYSEFDRAVFDLGIDSAVNVATAPDGSRGLHAGEATRSSALLSVPLSSCLIVGTNAGNPNVATAQGIPDSLKTVLAWPQGTGKAPCMAKY